MRTWYILSDGSFADPSDVAPDESGALRDKSGVAVALHASGVPKSRGMSDMDIENTLKARADAAAKASEAEAKKKSADAGTAATSTQKQSAGNYKTRESKAQ